MLTREQQEELYRRLGVGAIGSAMEEDAPPYEPMSPEELSPFVRKPVTHIEPPMPESAQAPPDILGGLEDAQQADALARQRAGFTNASKKAASAISGFTYKPDYVTPDAGSESAYLNRQKAVADYLLRKQRGDAYAEQVRRLNQPKPSAEKPLSAPPVVNVKDKSKLEDAQIDVMKARADALRRPKGTGSKKGGGGGKGLPTSALSELATFDVAAGELDALSQSFDALGMDGTSGKWAGRATSALGLQGTDSAKYQADAKRAMQAIGTILEGGKLAAGDEVKYREMLPKPGDSKAVKERKIAGLKAFLADLKAKKIEAYKAGGYNAPSLDHSGSTQEEVSETQPRQYLKTEGGFGYYYDENGVLMKEAL